MLFESVLKKFQKGNFLGPPFTLTSYMGETREIRLFSGKGIEGGGGGGGQIMSGETFYRFDKELMFLHHRCVSGPSGPQGTG